MLSKTEYAWPLGTHGGAHHASSIDFQKIKDLIKGAWPTLSGTWLSRG